MEERSVPSPWGRRYPQTDGDLAMGNGGLLPREIAVDQLGRPKRPVPTGSSTHISEERTWGTGNDEDPKMRMSVIHASQEVR